MFKHALK